MSYNPDIHHRRSIRLKGYDYRQPGAYFLTICTREKQRLFGDIVRGQMRLNHLGEIASRCWRDIPQHFPHIALDAFVVMPNHVHGILMITDDINPNVVVSAQQCRADTGFDGNHPHQPPNIETFGKPVRGSIPTIIRSYKSVVTRQINQVCGLKGVSWVWQRNYYEEVIRDEVGLNTLRDYIINNPRRWAEDVENVEISDNILDLPF